MSSRRSSRKRSLPTEPLRLQGEPGTFFDHHDHGRYGQDPYERKTRQLCEQVAEALSFALAECHNPRLNALYLEAVEPAPNASRLRVVVSAEPGADAPATLSALERARGYLRRQIAGSIHRKRTPELCFELVPPEAAFDDHEPEPLTSFDDKLTSTDEALTSFDEQLAPTDEPPTSFEDKLASTNEPPTSFEDKLASTNEALTSFEDEEPIPPTRRQGRRS